MKTPSKRGVLGIVFLTVFLDVVGFSILFPLFPALLDHYLRLEGEGSLIGRLASSLSDLAGGDQNGVATLFAGALGSLYGVLQFLFAPIWGSLSDRHGRRPVLLLTLAGTALSYLLWIFAGAFGLLVAARLLGGAMAGNISTASAVVADSTSGRERAGGMGIVGMAIGLGFIFGPVLGGVFGPGGPLGPHVSADVTQWTHGLALQPFSRCALVALVLSLLNLAFVATRLPETLTPERRGHGEKRGVAALLALGHARAPGVARTEAVYFVLLTAFSAAEFTLTFLAVHRLGWTIQDNTWMFVYIGLVIAFVQGGLVRRLAPRSGEKSLALLGLLLVLPGLALIAWAGSSTMLYVALFPLAVGSAFAMPCLSALVSRYTPPERQGIAQGSFRALGSLARAIGPILGGLLYWKLGSGAPFLVGAALMLIPVGLALGLPMPPAEEPEPAT